MNKELLYFGAIGVKNEIVIYIVAETIQIVEEIAHHYYKEEFKMIPMQHYKVPTHIMETFTTYNVSQGYYVYGEDKPVVYLTRKNMLDEILNNL